MFYELMISRMGRAGCIAVAVISSVVFGSNWRLDEAAALPTMARPAAPHKTPHRSESATFTVRVQDDNGVDLAIPFRIEQKVHRGNDRWTDGGTMYAVNPGRITISRLPGLGHYSASASGEYTVCAYGYRPGELQVNVDDLYRISGQEFVVRLQPCAPQELQTYAQLRLTGYPLLLLAEVPGDTETPLLRARFGQWQTDYREFPAFSLSRAEVEELIGDAYAESLIIFQQGTELFGWRGAVLSQRLNPGNMFACDDAKIAALLAEARDALQRGRIAFPAGLAENRSIMEARRNEEYQFDRRFSRKPFAAVDFGVWYGSGTVWAKTEIPELLRSQFGPLNVLTTTVPTQITDTIVETVIVCLTAADYAALEIPVPVLIKLEENSFIIFGEGGARLLEAIAGQFAGRQFSEVKLPRQRGITLGEVWFDSSPLIEGILLAPSARPLTVARSGNPDDYWLLRGQLAPTSGVIWSDAAAAHRALVVGHINRVVTIGFLAPVQEWSPQFKTLFGELALAMYRRGNPFSPLGVAPPPVSGERGNTVPPPETPVHAMLLGAVVLAGVALLLMVIHLRLKRKHV